MLKRRLIVEVLVPLGIGALIACFGYVIGRHYGPLAHRGAHVKGMVTAKELMNHQSVRYEFLVGTQRHSGITNIGSAFDRISVGDEVSVTYLPELPSVSVVGDAPELYRSWLHFLLMVPTSIAFIPMLPAVSAEWIRSHLIPM